MTILSTVLDNGYGEMGDYKLEFTFEHNGQTVELWREYNTGAALFRVPTTGKTFTDVGTCRSYCDELSAMELVNLEWIPTGTRFIDTSDDHEYLLCWVGGFCIVDVRTGHFYCRPFNSDDPDLIASQDGTMILRLSGFQQMLGDDAQNFERKVVS